MHPKSNLFFPFPPPPRRKTGRGGRGKGDRPDGSPGGGGGPGAGAGGDPDAAGVKLYMQPPLLELRVPEPELVFLTDLPGGLDNNEWMASHSQLLSQIFVSFLFVCLFACSTDGAVRCPFFAL